MCTLEMSPQQLMLLLMARQMTTRVVLFPPHHTPGLKKLVYEDEMRDYLVTMDMKSIVGWIIMIRLGALFECFITPLPGWPRWTAIAGRGVRA